MTLLTTIDDVKAVAQSDTNIQGLTGTELAVTNAMDLAEQMVDETRYLGLTKTAQTYLVAHILSLAFTEAGGRGPLSSESIGGISQSFTLPYLNQHTVLASTQYGLMYLEMRRHRVVRAIVASPS